MDNSSKDQQDELASLEAPSTVVEPSGSTVRTPESNSVVAPLSEPKLGGPPIRRLTRWITSRLNIYLLSFIILLVASGSGGAVLYFRSNISQTNIPSQPLSQSTLDQLASSDVNVGEPKHILSVQSDAVFSGNVLVRNSLQLGYSRPARNRQQHI
jgi:hypothetical protein